MQELRCGPPHYGLPNFGASQEGRARRCLPVGEEAGMFSRHRPLNYNCLCHRLPGLFLSLPRIDYCHGACLSAKKKTAKFNSP